MNYYNEPKAYESETNKYDKGNMQMKEGKTSCQTGADMYGMGCCMMPVYECPQERVCHRYICYDVPQV